MTRAAIAILDDSQHAARSAANWALLEPNADITVLHDPFESEDAAAATLAPFDILVPMRERTPFPASLIARLPRLRMIALTGARAPSLDIAACTAHGVLVCNTSMNVVAATAELAFALVLASARNVAAGDAVMRRGGWHEGVGMGVTLEGRTLGLLGLGRIGGQMAGYGRAFGMDVVAWSQNLTDETAAGKGARRVEKAELFATSDFLSIHLVLSERTRGIVDTGDLALMKPGAVLVNTSRGPLVDEVALVEALRDQRIRAGLDVYDREPPPREHPLRSVPGTVLTPHLGYATQAIFATLYGECVENIAAFLHGAPIRQMNPEAIAGQVRA